MKHEIEQIVLQADGESNSFGQPETVSMLRGYATTSAAVRTALREIKDLGESPEDMFLDEDQDAAWVDGWNMCLKALRKALDDCA